MDCHNKWLTFDGNIPHCTLPYSGTRYTLIYFTQQSYDLLGRAVDIQDDDGAWRQGEEAEKECLDGWGFPIPPPGLKKAEYEDAKLRLMKGEEAYKWWAQCKKVLLPPLLAPPTHPLDFSTQPCVGPEAVRIQRAPAQAQAGLPL
jgi:hypothetical protein